MKRNIQLLQNVMLGAFGLVLLGLVYWQLIRADDLLTRDDNPRRVIAEQQIRRGSIATIDGTVLAETTLDADGVARRSYPYPDMASVTGYYSLRYGTGGLEATFDSRLRGDGSQTRLDEWLHRPPLGQGIIVTINLPIQRAADAALAGAGASGAVVVLNAESGTVLALASQPGFDPNSLDRDWDGLIDDPAAPLLNRATQGVFPLGELARVVGLLGLFEAGATIPPEPFEAPLPQLLGPLSGQGLAATARQLNFDREISFELATAAGFIPDDLPAKAEEIAATPLHVALMGAAIMQQGMAPTPTLLAPAPVSPTRLFGIDTAAWASATLTEFSALASPDVTGNEPVSWYLGLFPGEPPLVVVALIIAPEADREAAQRLSQPIITNLR